MTKQTIIITTVVVYLFCKIFILEPNALEVNEYWIENNSLKGVKIAFLSDLNVKKSKGAYNRLKKIVKVTNEQKPDIVLFGGDFAYGGNLNKTYNINSVALALSVINTKEKFAVLGEEDNKTEKTKEIVEALKNNGIRVFTRDSAYRVSIKGRWIDIAGVTDKITHQPNISKALYRTMPSRILLSHNPDIYYDVMDDVSLILAGHTHGGQVIFPFIPALFVPSQFGSKFASGLIEETNNKMVISKGLGKEIG